MRDQEIALWSLDEETKKKLVLSLKLYSFDLTVEDLEMELRPALNKDPLQLDFVAGRYEASNVHISRVRRIITNTRGTLKIIIWEEGKFSIINREVKCSSLGLVNVNYDSKAEEMFETMKVGEYMTFTAPYWQQNIVFAQLTKCYTPEEIGRWMELYRYCQEKRLEFNKYQEMQSLSKQQSQGVFNIASLEKEKENVEKTIKEIEKNEAQEEIVKNTSLLSIINKPDGKNFILTFSALDGHEYSLRTPRQLDNIDFSTYVYRHRYALQSFVSTIKANTFFPDILQYMISRPTVPWFKLSVDKRPEVKLGFSFVPIKNQGNYRNAATMTVTYLNDKRVAYVDMETAVKDYFYRGEVLKDLTQKQEKTVQEIQEEERLRALELRNQRDNKIVEGGIVGTLVDMEGDCPIQIGFEKDKNIWNLVIGEKKIHLKGGVGTIKSLERVLKGTAQGYSMRHSTEEFYTRLCQVLSPEDALEVLSAAKSMGKLLSKIS